MQNARVTAFTVSELLRENEQVEGVGGGGGNYPPPRLGLMFFTNPLDMGYKLNVHKTFKMSLASS